MKELLREIQPLREATMKFYRIKSTEKGAKPPRWYRLLVPSGITFSQLYVLLAYVHGELYGLSSWYFFETKDRSLQIEEFTDSGPRFPGSFSDIYDAKGTYIDSVFHEGLKINQYTGTDFDLSIAVENEAEYLKIMKGKKLSDDSRKVMEEETCKAMFYNGQGLCLGSGQVGLIDPAYMTDKTPEIKIKTIQGIS